MNNKGFVLLETMLGLALVLVLAAGGLELVLQASKMLDKSRSYSNIAQVAPVYLYSEQLPPSNLRVEKEVSAQTVSTSSITKKRITFYEGNTQRAVCSFIVYE